MCLQDNAIFIFITWFQVIESDHHVCRTTSERHRIGYGGLQVSQKLFTMLADHNLPSTELWNVLFLQGRVFSRLLMGVLEAPLHEAHWMKTFSLLWSLLIKITFLMYFVIPILNFVLVLFVGVGWWWWWKDLAPAQLLRRHFQLLRRHFQLLRRHFPRQETQRKPFPHLAL